MEIPIFDHNGESDGKKKEEKEGVKNAWVDKMVDWDYVVEIILIHHRASS